MERYKPWNHFVPMDLEDLSNKVRCNPKRREKILAEHLDARRSETVGKNIWTLIGLFPWGLSVILDDYLRGGTPTIPMIKKLMTLYYDIFVESKYFDKKYLTYSCIGHINVPDQVKEFIANPTIKGKRKMDDLYCRHDERVRHYVDAAPLPDKMRPVWGIPFVGRLGPESFHLFEEDVKKYTDAKIAAVLTTNGVMALILKTNASANLHAHPVWGHLVRLIDSYGAHPRPRCPVGYFQLFE